MTSALSGSDPPLRQRTSRPDFLRRLKQATFARACCTRRRFRCVNAAQTDFASGLRTMRRALCSRKKGLG